MGHHKPVIRGTAVRNRSSSFLLVVFVILVAVGASACQPNLTIGSLDHKIYGTSLPEFQKWWLAEQARLRQTTMVQVIRWFETNPKKFDDRISRSGRWDLSTDLCSSSPDRGPGFDFRWPCIRHDLAWRNLRRLDSQRGVAVSTRERRLRASNQFLADMLRTCAGKPMALRVPCQSAARTYHLAVVLVS